MSDGERTASGRSSDSGNCPPIEDESQYGQKVLVSRIGTASPTEVSGIFADPPFFPCLQKRRTREGERSRRKLWKEIKEQGYPGAEATLRQFLQKWREAEDSEIRMQTVIKSSVPGHASSIRKIKRLLFGKQKKPLEQWEQIFLQHLWRDLPEIETSQKLVGELHQLMIKRQSEGFKRWLEKARVSRTGELVWFVNGVEQDRAPVEKVFESEWSQGQTEGQVNRLKFLKRQMYGRANFDLPRARECKKDSFTICFTDSAELKSVETAQIWNY